MAEDPWSEFSPTTPKADPWADFIPQQKPAQLNWSDVPGMALKNLPSSGSAFLLNMAQPFIHPVATATALKNIGQGALF